VKICLTKRVHFAKILILIVKCANLIILLNNECVSNAINLLNLNIFHRKTIAVFNNVINVNFLKFINIIFCVKK